MNFKTFGVIAAAICVAPTLAFAAPQTLDCSLQSSERHGWIPSRIVISYDKETLEARAIDDIIHSTIKRPVVAEFAQKSNSKIKLSWELENIPADIRITASYSANYDEAKRKIRISARIHGYDNRPYGTGSCQESEVNVW